MSHHLPLIIIHSDGPVASTSLAGLIEKFGYTFLPLRKFYLEEYISGSIPFYSDRMRIRVIEIIIAFSQSRHTGGVSVRHRNSLPPVILTSKPSADDISAFVSYKPTCLQDQIFSCLTFFSKFLTYKSVLPNSGFVILSLPRPGLNEELFLQRCHDDPSFYSNSYIF